MTDIELVRQFYTHLANADRQGAYGLLAEDFILKQALSLPYGGEFIGVNGLNEFFSRFAAYWKEFKTLHTDYYSAGSKVFAISRIRGVTNGGRIIETEMVQVYVVENLKLASAQPYYFDTALLSE